MITESCINIIKSKINILDIIPSSVGLVQRGSKYIACCPFHNESTPSFTVFEKDNHYKCFGCGKTGDAINFMMEYNGDTFSDAITKIAEIYNVPLEYTKSNSTPEERAKAKEKKEKMYDCTKIAVDFYQSQLNKNAEAINYCHQRNFSEATIALWNIGFAPDHRSNTLWQELSKQNLLEEGLSLGLIGSNEKTGNYYDLYRNRIIFPSRDRNGRFNGLIGRTIIPDFKPKYINPSENALYSKSNEIFGLFHAKQHIQSAGGLILVEGNIDVITAFQHGLTNVVCAGGTSLTEAQAKIICSYTKDVTLCYDGDKAGQDAMFKNIDILLPLGVDVSVINLPEDEDIDSVLSNHNNEVALAN